MSKDPVSFTLGVSANLAKAGLRKITSSEAGDGREYITHFSAEEPKPKAEPARVIPVKPNTLAKPAAGAESNEERGGQLGRLDDRFATAAPQAEGDGIYGLVQQTGSRRHAGRAPAQSMQDQADFKQAELPDAPSSDAYEDMPIEGFGEAMLRGMGMTGEATTGTVEFVPRPARMGLGAKPTDVSMLRC
jgi:G-patch domain